MSTSKPRSYRARRLRGDLGFLPLHGWIRNIRPVAFLLTSLVRMRSPVQIRSSAPETSQKWLVFLWFGGGFAGMGAPSCVLLTSILPGRGLSVFPSVFSPFDPFKSPVPQAFSWVSKISFPVRGQPVGRGDGQGGVGALLPAFYIMLQGHCRRGMSCRRLCLLDVLGRVV